MSVAETARLNEDVDFFEGHDDVSHVFGFDDSGGSGDLGLHAGIACSGDQQQQENAFHAGIVAERSDASASGTVGVVLAGARVS